ncbi:hypothetical protein AtNW77_Chr1g0079991 [Arabidopsis thaliana]|uniref:F28K19.12 n=2 Tax=Arabidopsis TaxID=3701 RepID=Q9SH10_ARATH|nr:uncharacterized protein AT1G77910 [Arabidopsis thaliana]AAF17681.1 F28K19.12 [Arabidopsis thaliana]AEE36044.1 transmembrane protein [Arabidopsis thaliana]KAG7652094.1 hypothetical protein ISN45_At01g068770 [Arabidopsis thaliana x Arabidopsis arenosa]|eukprot:NP_177914.1 transmembrane protein [Arabidopsis thaliana]
MWLYCMFNQHERICIHFFGMRNKRINLSSVQVRIFERHAVYIKGTIVYKYIFIYMPPLIDFLIFLLCFVIYGEYLLCILHEAILQIFEF